MLGHANNLPPKTPLDERKPALDDDIISEFRFDGENAQESSDMINPHDSLFGDDPRGEKPQDVANDSVNIEEISDIEAN